MSRADRVAFPLAAIALAGCLGLGVGVSPAVAAATDIPAITVVSEAAEAFAIVDGGGFSYQVPSGWQGEPGASDGGMSTVRYDASGDSLMVLTTPQGSIGQEQQTTDQIVQTSMDEGFACDEILQHDRTVNGHLYRDIVMNGSKDGASRSVLITIAFGDDVTAALVSVDDSSEGAALADPLLRAHHSLLLAADGATPAPAEEPVAPEVVPEPEPVQEEPVAQQAFNPDDYAWVSYDDIARNPDAFTGQRIIKSGPVLQVQEDDGVVVLRVATDEAYGDVVMMVYKADIASERILEGDFVYCYGTYMGLMTYEAVLGNSVTVPYMVLDAITR